MVNNAEANAKPVEPVLLGWSGGKDSALALEAVRQDPTLEVEALVTTVTEGYDRIHIHGVRYELLQRQAEAAGIPLAPVWVPIKCLNEVYEKRMIETLASYRQKGVARCVFGDLFLEDIRVYREKMLAILEMSGYYPVWGQDTKELAEGFVTRGFRAVLVCVDPNQLDPAFCGREFDGALLRELPDEVDPCGENGEFHTFVYDGPVFRHPLVIERGEVVEREGFWYCDLLEA